MKGKWDAILFDMDGTLIEIDIKEFLKAYFGLWLETAKKHTERPEDFVNNLIASVDDMIKAPILV